MTAATVQLLDRRAELDRAIESVVLVLQEAYREATGADIPTSVAHVGAKWECDDLARDDAMLVLSFRGSWFREKNREALYRDLALAEVTNKWLHAVWFAKWEETLAQNVAAAPVAALSDADFAKKMRTLRGARGA